MPHPLDAYFAAAPTAEQLVSVDEYSRGAVTRTETLWRGEPVAGGFFDPAVFGPLDGSVSNWGHLDVAVGIEIAGVRVTRIPVPPLARRAPFVVDDPLARTLWHGRINEAWIDLLHAIRTHDRFVSLGGPSQAQHVQQHFEDVVAFMRGEHPGSHHAHGDHAHDHTDVYTMMPCQPSEPARPLALLFLDDDRLLVQTTAGCRVLRRADSTWIATDITWTPTGSLASSVHGDLVIFNAGQRDVWRHGCYPDGFAWPEDASRSAPLAAYDLPARRWVMLVDDRFPPWVIDETDVAGTDAHELATGKTHDLASGAQRASALAQTRDGRFVLARMARLTMYDDAAGDDAARDDETNDSDESDHVLSIVEIATRRPFVVLPDPDASLPVVALGASVPSTQPAVSGGIAGWRIVDSSGAVGDGERWWYRLDGAAQTAWSPDGAQLAAIVGDELVILDITPMGAKVASRAHIG